MNGFNSCCRKTIVIISLILAVLFSGTPGNSRVFAKAAEKNPISSAKGSKTGWVKKGHDCYYYVNGVLQKNKLKKIGKYTYGFDKNGKSIRGKFARFGHNPYCVNRYYFNKKGHVVFHDNTNLYNYITYRYKGNTNKFLYAYMDVKVDKIDKPVKGVSWCLASNVIVKNDLYEMPIHYTGLHDKKGHRFPLKKLKNGSILRVFWDGVVLESYPMQIYGVRVKVLSV